ncbi:helix-turn-helix transcriptional regulator [Alkalicella caledoniensis]|uniref:Helix-turn-helix transcriptional regulator n=1 Tax=Alkalicella caledoniensis TaxID=2731377 RepID=A0A7G9W7H3_ALKCA|nr:metalloregulator ArsR/SmtB family transcription factor [Alkalicella caledoniensis]QNO14635.1 helix-turn-helix transcriptional regulator [Alkalicella caledoniensis]
MTNIDRCQATVIHQETVDKIRDIMLPDEKMSILADFFKVFGDATRIKILYALSNEEMCVCDISALLDMTQSAISHQLKVLRQGRLVKARKDGKVVYYSLNDDHISKVLNQGLEHILEE